MHLMLQILLKDVERLWRAILLTLALLAIWAYREATHAITAGARPIPQTTWLDFALPFAWSVVIALVILQDPLTGDRRFWPTLPCGWRPLLAAKAAFIAVFIQIPYFLATVAILFARGFNPANHMPHLFWKQLVLLGLTLPAAAAASVVKNIAQFLLLVITVASGAVFLSGSFNAANTDNNFWDVRWNLALILLAMGAIATIFLQFARRYTVRARMIAAIAALAAASLYNYLSRDASAAIYVAFHPSQTTQPQPSVNLTSREPDVAAQRTWYNYRRATALIPIDIHIGSPIRLDQISLDLATSSGEHYDAEWQTTSNGAQSDRIVASLGWLHPILPKYQVIQFYNPAVWSHLRRSPVTLHARILASFQYPEASVYLHPGERRDIPGFGHCSNEEYREAGSYGNTLFTVSCESIEVAPRYFATGWFFQGQIHFGQYLHEHVFFGLTPYPDTKWLSPLRSGTNSMQGEPGTSVVTPQTPLGSAVIDYTIPNLDLKQYVVHEPAKQEANK